MRRTVIDVSAMDLRNAKRAAVADLNALRASVSEHLLPRQVTKVVSPQARKRVRT